MNPSRIAKTRLAVLVIGIAAFCLAHRSSSEILLLASAKQTRDWIDPKYATLRSFSVLGRVRTEDGREFRVSEARFTLDGMLCPRGVNHVFFHDEHGTVVSTVRYAGNGPKAVVKNKLILEDGTCVNVDRPGFVQWANGSWLEDHIFFGMSDEEFAAFK